MDGLCQKLLAGAGFTEQENRMVCAGHTLCLGKNFLEGPARTDHSPVVVLQIDLLTKIDVLLFEAIPKLLVFGKCGPNRFAGPLAHEGIGKDLRNQLQPMHEWVRPNAFVLLHVLEGQCTDQRPASCRQRDCQGSLDAEMTTGIPVAGGLDR